MLIKIDILFNEKFCTTYSTVRRFSFVMKQNKSNHTCSGMILLRFNSFLFSLLLFQGNIFAQNLPDTSAPTEIDTEPKQTTIVNPDTILRIKNLQPFFTLHVDSTLRYKLEINKNQDSYYWYLKNAPVGLKIDKDNGELFFKASKSYFLSGKLKYDTEYKVQLGVQNLNNPKEKTDTIFSLFFYNTEIIPGRLHASIVSPVILDEGDSVSFNINCITGSFPFESVKMESNYLIKNQSTIQKCEDVFSWKIPYDFIKDSDSSRARTLVLRFTGTDKFGNQDSTIIQIIIRNAINFKEKKTEYEKVTEEIRKYNLKLKMTFRTLDQKIRKNKNTRITFDMTSATTALGGTIFSSLSTPDQKTAGRILPSVGVALVPVKEAVSPNRVYEQNSAALLRASIKRLDYLLSEYALAGTEDPDINYKTSKLRAELKQIQLQLIEIPLEETIEEDAQMLDKYFNNPKVNKKYRLKKKRKS